MWRGGKRLEQVYERETGRLAAIRRAAADHGGQQALRQFRDMLLKGSSLKANA